MSKEPFIPMSKELFIHTFKKYFGEHISGIYIPKITKATLYRMIIYYLQLAADASGVIISAVEIQETSENQYRITINKAIVIDYSLAVKGPALETTAIRNY
jgi:hypothetical protein